MTAEQFRQMDPYIAISIVNMKLRDQYGTLERLSDDWGIDAEIIRSKFKAIGYEYSELTHQFISQED